MKTPGQLAYETDCERRPDYHDATPRRTWANLPDYARWSWERNPTPREPAKLDQLANFFAQQTAVALR